MRFCDLTPEIIGAAVAVHRSLGPGLLESAYEACLAYKLGKIGLTAERQKPVPLIYEAVRLECGFRADMVVEGRVVVEIKSKECIHPVDEAQLLCHLRLLQIPVGLLINFNVLLLKDGIRRRVNNYHEPVLPENGVTGHSGPLAFAKAAKVPFNRESPLNREEHEVSAKCAKKDEGDVAGGVPLKFPPRTKTSS
jgi:GxxExxY protein